MSGYGVFARYYDALTGNVDYRARASYFDRVLRLHGPEIPEARRGDGRSPLLLDLACGTGSLSLALAELGYDVIGADASEEMLAVAMQKAAEAERRILFLRQSMEELDLYGTVDAAVCALDSLNHLSGERALEAVLDRLRLFVAPGGLFVFDVNTRYKHREVLGNSDFIYETDEVFCAWRNRCDSDDDSVEIALDFFEEGPDGRYRRSEERFRERVFSPEALETALGRSGFRVLAVYGDDTLDPPGERTERAVYVALRGE